MSSSPSELARRLVPGLVDREARAVVLAGSHARGDATSESDLDIVIVGVGPAYRLEARRVCSSPSRGRPKLEERQLFPLIEELVPDDELQRLGLADRDATCAVRRPPLTS